MIGITGATGLVGRRLTSRLLEEGRDVLAFSRRPTPSTQRGVRTRGWPPRPDDLALDGVVHLLGEPVAGRWTDRKKAAIRDSRIEGTRLLVDAIAALPSSKRPRVLVSASAIGYYGERGDETLDEESSPGSDFLAEVCIGWEREARRAEELGTRVVRLRIGLVMSAEGGALERMLLPFRLGAGGRLGSGRQWWSWIGIDDLVGLIHFALDESKVRGPLNAVSPRPVQQKDFAATLGRLVRRPALVPTPAFALRLALGEFAYELVASRRVVPRATLDAGFRFRHEDLAACLSETLGAAR